MNVQFAIQHGKLYVLEVNPRASRTVPFVVEGDRRADGARGGAARGGQAARALGLPPERDPVDFFIKAPVFPFRKFPGEDMILGPEMKSTGEVMGISPRFGDAFAKACEALGHPAAAFGQGVSDGQSVRQGGAPADRPGARRPRLRALRDRGDGEALREGGVEAERVFKVNEGSPNAVDRMEAGEIQIVVNTPLGSASRFDEAAIRAAALRLRSRA